MQYVSCPRCGTELPRGRVICKACGARIPDGVYVAPHAPKAWLRLLSFFVSPVGFALAAWLYLSGDPHKMAAAKVYALYSLAGVLAGIMLQVALWYSENKPFLWE